LKLESASEKMLGARGCVEKDPKYRISNLLKNEKRYVKNIVNLKLLRTDGNLFHPVPTHDLPSPQLLCPQ